MANVVAMTRATTHVGETFFSIKRKSMTEINELNIKLYERLSSKFQQSKRMLEEMNSSYPEVLEVKERLLNFNLQNFELKVNDRLKSVLIGEWIKYNSRGIIKSLDMIYFEFHEQSNEHSHAYSYGVYDLNRYQLTIENYDMGYDYKFDWEAGEGLILEPFETTSALNYDKFEDKNYHDLISYKDPLSGSKDIWNYIYAACNSIFYNSFKNADKEGLFKDIQLKQGGFFSYNIHDDGLSMPFYIKNSK